MNGTRPDNFYSSFNCCIFASHYTMWICKGIFLTIFLHHVGILSENPCKSFGILFIQTLCKVIRMFIENLFAITDLLAWCVIKAKTNISDIPSSFSIQSMQRYVPNRFVWWVVSKIIIRDPAIALLCAMNGKAQQIPSSRLLPNESKW